MSLRPASSGSDPVRAQAVGESEVRGRETEVPIREYRCSRCGAQFEVLVLPGEDESALTCPKCQSKEIRRRMSVFCGRVPNGGTGATKAGPGGGCSSCSGGNCSTCH